MALWESIKAAAKGNFSDATGYLFVSQDEVDRGRRLDSQLEEMRRKEYEQGLITADQLELTIGRINAQAFKPNGIFSQEGTDIASGLAEGAADGLQNIQSNVKESVRSTINFGAGLIPWQGWVILAVYLAWRLGWINFKR